MLPSGELLQFLSVFTGFFLTPLCRVESHGRRKLQRLLPVHCIGIVGDSLGETWDQN